MSRILIVEDEVRVAAFLEKGLRKHGFDTSVAEDGEQAISMLEGCAEDLSVGEDIRLMLLDLGLPIKDGWSVLRELRDRGNLIPIIIVTAQGDESCRAAAIAAGANDYVAKPFRFNDLLTKVRSHLDN